jgi:hypothetical protein
LGPQLPLESQYLTTAVSLQVASSGAQIVQEEPQALSAHGW